MTNAQAFLKVQQACGSFDAFLWRYVDHAPVVGRLQRPEDVPASTPLSQQISRDLKKLGFKFVGPTVVYAFLQSTGVVNDHLADCFVLRETQP